MAATITTSPATRAAYPTSAQAEADVRAFAVECPGPNVQRAVELCEAGRITWHQAAELFARALGVAVERVSAV